MFPLPRIPIFMMKSEIYVAQYGYIKEKIATFSFKTVTLRMYLGDRPWARRLRPSPPAVLILRQRDVRHVGEPGQVP